MESWLTDLKSVAPQEPFSTSVYDSPAVGKAGDITKTGCLAKRNPS
jgi:hypothetical protein